VINLATGLDDPERVKVALLVPDAGVVWFAQECRRNGVALESFIRVAERAGDPELVEFFARARRASHQLTTGATR
jgi:hypothetical protein